MSLPSDFRNGHAFGPDSLDIMQRAFDQACHELGAAFNGSTEIRDAVARAVVTAFEAGGDEKAVIAAALAKARLARLHA